MTTLVYDPVSLNEYSINEWISMDINDNIIFIIDNEYIGLKRSYFILHEEKNIFVQCDIENKQLIVDSTLKNKKYINLHYLLGKHCIIEQDKFNNILNKNQKYQIFNIYKNNKNNKNNNNKIDVINYNTLSYYSKNIKEYQPTSKKHFVSDQIHKYLRKYSFQWDAPINSYLNMGERYFRSTIFNYYWKRYGVTKYISIQNIKNVIKIFDEYMYYDAPRTTEEMSKMKFYRGMKNPYFIDYINQIPLENKDETMIVNNFISISLDTKVAIRFSDELNHCCFFEITLDKGIPYIDMILHSQYPQEREILLPRGLKIKLLSEPETTYVLNKSYESIKTKLYKIHIFYDETDKFYSSALSCKKKNIYDIEVKEQEKIKEIIDDIKLTSPNIKEIPIVVNQDEAKGKKQCKPEQVLNPKTNRCVSRKGSIGKKILEEKKTKSISVSIKKLKSPIKLTSKTKKCKPHQILNPKTNRCVNKDGTIGKKLLNL